MSLREEVRTNFKVRRKRGFLLLFYFFSGEVTFGENGATLYPEPAMVLFLPLSSSMHHSLHRFIIQL